MSVCSDLRKLLITGPGLALAATVLLGTGCGKSGIEGELERFRSGGHTVAQFADTDPAPLGAKKCQAGTIDQLSVLLCEYSSSDVAGQSQPAAERWGGEIGTVVVLRRGPLSFTVADRNHVDPNGKTISALSKVFRRTKGR
jgi:hypothetical protein